VTAVPLYDYRCSAGHRFEAMAPLAAPDSGVCPCGADAVKVPSRVALGGVAEAVVAVSGLTAIAAVAAAAATTASALR